MKDKLLALAAGNHHLIGLSINDAVIATGVGRDQIYNAIRDGRLPAKKWVAARSSCEATWTPS